MTVKEKFDKVFSRKELTVEEIDFSLFNLKEKKNWFEYLELLKKGARASVKDYVSRLCLLSLYWLRFGEQLSKQQLEPELPRDGIFFKDQEIPEIIFTEGKRVLVMLQEGKSTKDNFKYLNDDVRALGNLDIDKKKSLMLLMEVSSFLDEAEVTEDIIMLRKSVLIAIEKRTMTRQNNEAKDEHGK